MKHNNIKQYLRKLLFCLSTLLPLLLSQSANCEETLRVVATLSTYAELAKELGGEFVKVHSIVPAKFDPHFIEPRPSDVLKLKRADLFIHSGLDLELWRGPLLDAAGSIEIRPGGSRELDLSHVIRLLEVPSGPITRAKGDMHAYGNPHYWLDPANGRAIARAISKKLKEILPDHADVIEQRLSVFEKQLSQKQSEWKAQALSSPIKEIVAYHDQWIYLTYFLNVKSVKFLEPFPGIPPTPRQIKFLSDYIKREGVGVIAQAGFYPTGTSRRLAEKSNARLALLCQNTGGTEDCGSYIEMLDYNIKEILKD